MFYGECLAGKSAAFVSKDPLIQPADRVAAVRELLGESPSDLTIFEYLRSHGILDILYRVIPEDRVREARRNVIRWVLAHPPTSPRKRKFEDMAPIVTKFLFEDENR